MKKRYQANDGSSKRLFIKPELKILDVKNTKSGPRPDPFEFDPLLQETNS